jgi:type II secretory pathway pseudopilin PulG
MFRIRTQIDYQPRPRRGLGGSDVLLTVAIIGLALGFVTSLARNVREEARRDTVSRTFRELDNALTAYLSRHDQPPSVERLLPPEVQTLQGWTPTPGLIDSRSTDNNRLMLRALSPFLDDTGVLATLPPVRYDGRRLLDPWGTPYAYIADTTGLLGIAANGRPFFLSAGPDRDFTTRGDNLYSYEDSIFGPSAFTDETVPDAALDNGPLVDTP